MSTSPGVFVGDYGATGDGVTDDTSAVQAALSDAASRGVPLVLGHGVYRIEQVAISSADQVTIVGQGHESTTLKLRDDDGQGGLGQILRFTDVSSFALRDVCIHGNFAGAKAGTELEPLVVYATTSATQGRDDFSVLVENVRLVESAKGFGQLRFAMYENEGAIHARFAHVVVRNVTSFAHGTFGPAVAVVGPANYVHVENVSTRNDGPFGLECTGLPTYPGARDKPLFIASNGAFDHHVSQATVTGLSAFRDNGALYVQGVKQLHAANITVTEDATNPFYDVAPAPFTVNVATDTVSATVPPGGYGNSSIVRLSSAGTLPAPLVPGRLYYVRDRSGDQFRLAGTNGGSAINITDAGTGSHSIEFLGYSYTTAVWGNDNLHSPEAPAHHHYSNVQVVRPSPHTTNRDFAWNETKPNTAGRVVLEDCSFYRPVNVSAGYAGLQHIVRRCDFEGAWLPNASYGTLSPLSIAGGLVQDCDFHGFVTIAQDSDLVIRDCRFDMTLRHVLVAGVSAILRLLNNVWNVADVAAGQLVLSPPRNGGRLLIELRGNRVPQGATKATTATLSSTDKTGLTVSASDNDITVAF